MRKELLWCTISPTATKKENDGGRLIAGVGFKDMARCL